MLLHFCVDEAPVDLSKVEAETYWDLFPPKDARQLRRLALISAVVLASTLLMAPWSRGATNATPPGLPLFQFVNSGTGPLPWNAASLESALHNTNMLGGPHGASDATEGALAYRTTSSDVALYTRNVDGLVDRPVSELRRPGARGGPRAVLRSVGFGRRPLRQ